MKKAEKFKELKVEAAAKESKAAAAALKVERRLQQQKTPRRQDSKVPRRLKTRRPPQLRFFNRRAVVGGGGGGRSEDEGGRSGSGCSDLVGPVTFCLLGCYLTRDSWYCLLGLVTVWVLLVSLFWWNCSACKVKFPALFWKKIVTLSGFPPKKLPNQGW